MMSPSASRVRAHVPLLCWPYHSIVPAIEELLLPSHKPHETKVLPLVNGERCLVWPLEVIPAQRYVGIVVGDALLGGPRGPGRL